MRKTMMTFAVAAMLVAFPMLAHANQQTSATKQEVMGQVMMVTPDQVTIRTDAGQTRDFAITNNTAGRDYLVQGQQVDLWYRQNPDTGKVEVIEAHQRQSKKAESSNSGMQSHQASSSSSSSSKAAPSSQQKAQTTSSSNSSHPATSQSTETTTKSWPAGNRSNSSQKNSMSSNSQKKLPQTASDMPLILVIGVVSVAGALGVRFAVRH